MSSSIRMDRRTMVTIGHERYWVDGYELISEDGTTVDEIRFDLADVPYLFQLRDFVSYYKQFPLLSATVDQLRYCDPRGLLVACDVLEEAGADRLAAIILDCVERSGGVKT